MTEPGLWDAPLKKTLFEGLLFFVLVPESRTWWQLDEFGIKMGLYTQKVYYHLRLTNHPWGE
jgi:hypothetical protein